MASSGPAGGKNWGLWLRWVVVNAVGELGLGGALALWVLAAPMIAAWTASLSPWIAYTCGIVAGTLIEGVWVGVVQWGVLRRELPARAGRAWVLATAAAGFVSWSAAMVFMALSLTQAGSLPVPGVSSVTQLALVMVMGAGLGLMLGVPQWLVLKRYARQTGWWVLANVVAWALGLPVILAAALCIPADASRSTVASAMLLGSVLAGATVGAVHGLELMSVLLRGLKEEGGV